MNWKGLGTALITPFIKGKSIDFEAYAKILAHQKSSGVDYLVVAGTTGEGVTLTNEEIKELLVFSKKETGLPIVIGVGSNNTKIVEERIRFFDKFSELDAYLIVTPYYNKPNQDGLYLHYSSLAKLTKKEIIVYNVPGRTGGKIMPETLLRLVDNYDNIVAIKEASGDINFSMDIYKTLGKANRKIFFLSGDDMLAVPMIALGYDGLISVASNEFPRELKYLVDTALENPIKAREQHYKLLDKMRANFFETNPVVVKYAMKKLGFCDGSLRPPLAELISTEPIDKVLELGG